MKKLIVIMLSALFMLGTSIGETYAKSSHRVRGYTRKSGAYVAPHRKTNPDKSKFNNYSAKGNFNPYTGKKGTKDPFKK
ncbi:MAG: hypothetical protein ACOY7U_08565 [Acidobacteriota bacterium]|jgi:hypothetical protein